MSRVQLALNVSDLDRAIEFYSKLFDAEPAKVRPGYANFAVVEPPLKLVLIEHATADRGAGVEGALNHLGVEVESPEDVVSATRRLSSEGLDTEVQEHTTCCYALQDKVWVNDPDGAPGRCTRCSPTLPPSPVSRVTADAVRPQPPTRIALAPPSPGAADSAGLSVTSSPWMKLPSGGGSLPRRSVVPSWRPPSSGRASRRNGSHPGTSASSCWRTRLRRLPPSSPSS